MPLIDGIELGSRVRKQDREAQILYATTEPQYALKAYRANPLDYLVKPIGREQIFEALSKALEKIGESGEPVFPLRTGHGESGIY